MWNIESRLLLLELRIGLLRGLPRRERGTVPFCCSCLSLEYRWINGDVTVSWLVVVNGVGGCFYVFMVVVGI